MVASEHLVDLAVRASVARWLMWEKDFWTQLRTGNRLSPLFFEGWLRRWGFSNRLTRQQRDRLFPFLRDVARPAFLAESVPGCRQFDVVDEINAEAVEQGIATSALHLVLTAFACSCAPDVYPPLHRDARRGMQNLGVQIPDMSCATYIKTFYLVKSNFLSRNALIVEQYSGCTSDPQCVDIVGARSTDHWLRLVGGLPADQLEAEIGQYLAMRERKALESATPPTRIIAA